MNAEQEREALRRRWRDGGRTALGLLDRERERGGYPRGFHQWPIDKRNASYAAYNLAYLERRHLSEGMPK